MNIPIRLAVLLGTMVAVGLTCVLGPAAPATAAPPVTVTLTTVPATPGAVFVLDGRPLTTDASGSVRITVPHGLGGHRLQLRTTALRSGDREWRFVRWWGQRRHEQDRSSTIVGLPLRRDLTIRAGFEVYQRVRLRYADQAGHVVPPTRVRSVTFRSESGREQTVRGTTARLLSVRPVLQDSTLVARPQLYAVQRVDVDGANVVNANEQRFRPGQRADLRVVLLLRRLQLRPRDLLSGRPVGTSVDVTYPDGRTRRYRLGSDGTVTLEGLARGHYLVRSDASGYSPPRPVALSRNQTAPIEVVTRPDLAVLGVVVALVAIGLVLLGRPGLRRGTARWVRRPRRVPADANGQGAAAPDDTGSPAQGVDTADRTTHAPVDLDRVGPP